MDAGLLFPLVWDLFANDWATMGFTRRNLGYALIWGSGGGIPLIAATWFITEHKLAPLFALQLIVGMPIWLLIMSPSQEFLFRGCRRPAIVTATG
jgi:hypothetical protein